MKADKLLSRLVAFTLAFLLSFGGVAAMVTAFDMDVSVAGLALSCLVVAALGTWLCGYRFGWAIYAGLLSLLLLSGELRELLRGLVAWMMEYWSGGYQFPMPPWCEAAPTDGLIKPLVFVAGVVSCTVAWTVLRRHMAYVAVGFSLLPMACCVMVTVTVPDNFAIFCYIFGLILLIFTQSTRKKDAAQGDRLTVMLLLPVAAALMLLLTLVPRESYSPLNIPTWNSANVVQNGGDSIREKLDSNVDLSKEGNRNLTERPVMEVTTDYSGKLYLRGRHYHSYTGTAWEVDLTKQEPTLSPSQMWLSGEQFQVTVKMRKSADYRFAPYYYQENQGFSGGAITTGNLKNYAYEFRPIWNNWQAHWRSLGDMPLENIEYLRLPQQTKDWAEILAIRIQTGSDAYDVPSTAAAIEKYVKNSAEYNLKTPRMPEEESDFVRWFLNKSDTGYCVHFASSAVVLLRAAGIPARYVEGFTVESTGTSTVVQEKMAHAWVEYYVNGLGWVILDPTPGEANQVPVTTAPTEPSGTEQTNPSEQTAPTTQAHTPQPTTQSQIETVRQIPGWLKVAAWWLVGIAGFALVVVAQWLIRRWYKLRRMYQGKPNAQALARYREAKRLEKLSGEAIPGKLTELAQKAKFSNHSLNRAELMEFDRYLAENTRKMCEKNGWWHLLLRFVFALR